MAIRLNDLRNFIAASACRTFSEAARKLGVTQPSLSESIARLEKDLNKRLFYRAKSGIALTPEGRDTFERARGIEARLSELEGDASVPPVLRLGAHPVVAGYAFPDALTNFYRAQPRARVTLEHGLSRGIQEQIQRGGLDVGVVINPVANPDLVISKLARDEFKIWMHPQGARRRQIIYDPELIQAATLLRKWRKRPGEVLTTSSLELITRLTAARLGFGILPAQAVKLVGENLIAVPGTPEFIDEICLLHRPEFGKTTYEKHLIKCLKASFV